MERQERILRWDSVASAYIAAGRIDRLMHEETQPEFVKPDPPPPSTKQEVDIKENGVDLQRKQSFLSQLKLVQVSSHYKQGEFLIRIPLLCGQNHEFDFKSITSKKKHFLK